MKTRKGGFTLMWSGMLESSLWIKHDGPTRLVWVTLMMMKDAEGIVHTQSAAVIAHVARVTEDEARKALEIFEAPDPDSHIKAFEGRRIRKVEGGYELINSEEYRYSSEATRAYWTAMKARQRERDAKKLALAKKGRKGESKPKKGGGVPSGDAYAIAEAAGASAEQLEALAYERP